MPAGAKSWDVTKSIEFEGAFSREAMHEFAIDNANIHELSKVTELDS